MTARIALVTALVLLSAQALWAEDLPDLTSSGYNIDLYQGAVLGSPRIIGLSGAYAAIAEDSAGIPFNPASVANRTYYGNDWWDYDIGFDYLVPGLFQTRHFDFDNNDRSIPTSQWALNLGGYLQFSVFGLGIYWRQQNYDIDDKGATTPDLTAKFHIIQMVVGWAFSEHQFVLGGGVRIGLFEIEQVEDEDAGVSQETLFKISSGGLEIGALYRPKGQPFRIGAALRAPGGGTLEENKAVPGFAHMPSDAVLPVEFRLGFSWRFGEREYNPTPGFHHPRVVLPGEEEDEDEDVDFDEEYEGEPYLLLTAELVITGYVPDAIGSDGFVQQINERSGRKTSYSPRFGAETEVLERRLRFRTGFYWEPSRFDHFAGRMHWTFAVQVRLFDLSFFLGDYSFAASLGWDFSHRYQNVILSVGLWH